MWQEIITYLIIAAAVAVAVLKTRKKFRKKKRQLVVQSQKTVLNTNHNCSDCPAECILRDSVAPQRTNAGETACTQPEKESDGL